MFDKARYIVVEGPSGSGKTSFAKKLAEHLHAHTALESLETNPFLGRFHQNQERWLFSSEVAFLFQRIDALNYAWPLIQDEQRVVSDFLLQKDAFVAGLYMSAEENVLYQRLYETICPAPPLPDLLIYLQATPPTLLERLRRQGYEIERKITEADLSRNVERHARFFFEFTACPLFIVDAERLNPIENEDDFQMVVKHMKAMRGFREFFGYAG
jgi:deoxyguanosine kinase